METGDITITIAVIVYKVEKYIRECLDSVISQKGSDIEILIVNDASPDSCGKICDEYAKRDSRVRVIHHDRNKGASAARNTCINNARGHWITFVDGDDKLTDDAIQTMLLRLDDLCDIIVFDYIEIAGKNALERTGKSFDEFDYSDEKEIADYRLTIIGDKKNALKAVPIHTPWAKIIRKQFLKDNNLKFNTKMIWGEDTVFSLDGAYKLNRVKGFPYKTYMYRINPSAITWRYIENSIELQDDFLNAMKDILDKNNDNDDSALNAFALRIMEEVQASFKRTAYHTKCRWGKKKRLSWLKSICSNSLVDFSVMRLLHTPCSNSDTQELAVLIHEKNLQRIDVIYRKRRKEQIVSTIKQNLVRFKLFKMIYLLNKRINIGEV